MIVDFRKKKNIKESIHVDGNPVEKVRSFKLLGTTVTEDLSWHQNSVLLLKKARQRLFFLRTLKSYRVQTQILTQFYHAIIESALTYSVIVWCGDVTQKDMHRLNSVVETAKRIIGLDVPQLREIYEKRIRSRARAIIEDKSHPANHYFEHLQESAIEHLKEKIDY